MKNRLKSHNWVTLVNPRNGKVRINACARCGILKMGSALKSQCSDSIVKSNSLAGWREVSQLV